MDLINQFNENKTNLTKVETDHGEQISSTDLSRRLDERSETPSRPRSLKK